MALVYTPECARPAHADASPNDTPTSYEDFLDVLANLTLSGPSLIIDCDRKRVQRNGESLELTRQEIDLLIHLALHTDEVVSRDELFESVWAHRELDAQSRTVDIHIRRLRVKLEDAELISTVRGQGYRFNSSTGISIRAVAAQRGQHTLAA